MTRNAGSTPDETLLQHVAAHRPGRSGKTALDPELRAFVEAQLAHRTFAGIEADMAAHFPPDRRTGLSAIHRWWQRMQRSET